MVLPSDAGNTSKAGVRMLIPRQPPCFARWFRIRVFRVRLGVNISLTACSNRLHHVEVDLLLK
jgi:hypothetical protein